MRNNQKWVATKQIGQFIFQNNQRLYFFLKERKWYTYKVISVGVICWYALIVNAGGSEFDGSKNLTGTTGKIIEINQYKITDDIAPDTVGLPKKFVIDFKTMSLRPSKDSLVRKTITFKSVDHIENMVILQGIDQGVEGVDDGLAWSLTISKEDGKAVLSASGGGVAYVVFGVCTPVKDN